MNKMNVRYSLRARNYMKKKMNYINLKSTKPYQFVSFAELNDDWSLATSLKDFSEYGENEMADDTSDFDIFPVKYLGCTQTELPRSEEATAVAIKSIIATAKGSLKIHRVNIIT